MAGKIDLNVENGFGGAFVIVPPAGGDPHTLLILDGGNDPALFWSTLQTKVTMVLEEIRDKDTNGPFGGMRR